MIEFRINDYLTLRREDEKTVIYIAGERFRQCKYLLLDIQANNLQYLNELESIDEAIVELGYSREVNIPPDVEFWGHCSNLQVWVESVYNTRLLHRNLSFPLLTKLAEVGDTSAKAALKQEIIARVNDSRMDMLNWFLEDNFFNLFSEHELRNLFLNNDDYDSIYLLENYLGKDIFIGLETDDPLNNIYVIRDKKIIKIKIYLGENKGAISEVPDCISGFHNLKILELQQNSFNILPNSIGSLRSLNILILSANNLKFLPPSIGDLRELKELHLDHNNLKELPDSIGALDSLEYLDLSNNSITKLPESIYHLRSLKFLSLVNNPIILDEKSLEKLRKMVDRFFI